MILITPETQYTREMLKPRFEIGTTDSTDFTDFEEDIGDGRTNLFVAKLQGVTNRNLLYL